MGTFGKILVALVAFGLFVFNAYGAYIIFQIFDWVQTENEIASISYCHPTVFYGSCASVVLCIVFLACLLALACRNCCKGLRKKRGLASARERDIVKVLHLQV